MEIGEIAGVKVMVSPEHFEKLKKQKLIEENEILKEQQQEIERLNNIINELEKYGKQRFNEYEVWKEECKNLCYINGITEMLDKLQELKGVDKE